MRRVRLPRCVSLPLPHTPAAARAGAVLDEYELLERECDSTAFKSYSPEEQAELRAQLTAVQSAIEQRENRLNIIAAAVGGLYGSYVGTMSAMLCSACPAALLCA